MTCYCKACKLEMKSRTRTRSRIVTQIIQESKRDGMTVSATSAVAKG